MMSVSVTSLSVEQNLRPKCGWEVNRGMSNKEIAPHYDTPVLPGNRSPIAQLALPSL
jgi:hypothetical protein